jgi:TRAP-type transport system periplasmic protein
MKQKMVMIVTILLLSISLSIPSAMGQAKAIKLQIASWNVPKDPNTEVLKAIAADLEQVSKGQITSDISFRALGKPEDYYDAAVAGICDIAYVGLPYTPGRFPISEVLGLPIKFPNNQITAKAHYELWKRGYLNKQFSDVHVICVGSTSPYVILWAKEIPNTLAAFKSKKVRSPGGPWSVLLEALGVVPVGVSVAESYMALEKGTIDGILQTWPAVPVFKLNEVSRYVTELNLTGFGFAVVMNKTSYDKLPPEARTALDNNAEKYSLLMGKMHQGFNEVGMKMIKDSKGLIQPLPAEEQKLVTARLRPIFDKWAKDTNAKGLPGTKVLDELYSILQTLGVKEPFPK